MLLFKIKSKDQQEDTHTHTKTEKKTFFNYMVINNFTIIYLWELMLMMRRFGLSYKINNYGVELLALYRKK